MNQRLVIGLALALSGSVASAVADDPTGWKEIPWGSPPSAFEDVEEIESFEDPDTELFRGEELTLEFQLDEYRVAGIPFEVKFYFDHEEEFSAFTLTWEGEEDRAEDAYQEIVRLLEERYKRKSVSSDESHRFGNSYLVRSELGDASNGEREITITYLDPNEDQVDRL
ncbi:MAG: hypothetical protein WD342_13480 [Verrucomicrobiales bacterium]